MRILTVIVGLPAIAMTIGCASAALPSDVAVAGAPTVVASEVVADPGVDGAEVYRRCAACHLPTGAGIPGAFPPLQNNVRQLAQTADGRQYLVLVVSHGLAGRIEVAGRTYSGVMPAQSGLDDQSIAAVLNYLVGSLASSGAEAQPFAASEIAAARHGGVK